MSPPDPAHSTPSVRYAVAGTLTAAALQILVGALMYLHRAEFTLAQARLHPELPLATIRDRAEGIVAGGLGTHVVLAIAYLFLARGVLRAQRRARIRLTILLVVATIAGTVAAIRLGADVPSIHDGIVGIQALSTALRVAVLYLLWIPRASRSHFALAT